MRISQKDLENVIARLNRLTGNPEKPYIYSKATKRNEPQAHCYLLDSAYGGNQLSQMCATGTGQSTIIHGFVSKRELYDKIQTFISGIEAGKELVK